MRLIFVVIYFVHTIDGIERHPPNQNPSRQHHQQQQQHSGQMKVRKCEQIEIEMCRELGYNITGMPNFVGHESQQDAQQQLTTFTPLIQYGCSSRLRFFLCSAYVPMCSEKAVQLIGPCAPLCESVRQRCEPVLMQFGFPWPLALNCSRFLPRNEDDSMCIEVPSEEPDTHGTTTANRLQVPETAGVPHITTDSAPGSSSGSSCDVFRNPSNYVALNRTRQCALLCSKDDVFNADQKMFADAWMSVWSGLCFVTTFVTILIFLIDMRRFGYPDRALVYVAVCYNVCSVGYLVRLIGGRDAIACREVPELSKKVVVREGIENTECTFVFLLVYYFSTAGSIWCVILTVLWFLNSGLERPYDSLARHGTLLHLIAWSVPSAAAIAVVVMRGVDADELTAMCHVGYHSQTMQLSFVLIPTAVFLLADVVFFTSGLVCSLRRRRSSEARNSGRTGGKKEGQTAGVQTEARSSPVRIGAFLMVNLVLTVCALSVQCYEYADRQQWPLQLSGTEVRTPNVSVLMLGVAVNLTVGIVSAVWLWRGESLRSLQRFCSRLSRCCCLRTTRLKQQDPTSSAPAAAATPDRARLQTPLATTRGKPIYRVTTEAFERNGRSRHFVVPLKSSHHCRRHHHHFHHSVSLPLTTHNSPPPPPPPSHDKSSSRSPLRCHDLSSEVSML